jgi:hypothetical protein
VLDYNSYLWNFLKFRKDLPLLPQDMGIQKRKESKCWGGATLTVEDMMNTQCSEIPTIVLMAEISVQRKSWSRNGTLRIIE